MVDSALDFISDDELLLNQEKDNPKEQHVPAGMRRERIKIIGVGGGGNNALDHIIRNGVQGVEFLAVNTDAHCLEKCLSVEKLMIGERLTKGHGAGANPEIGELAAVESRDAIRSCLKGCDMIYLAAGMGGGTGTGALPVIAEIAKDMGILTVSVVTRPFSFEGKKKRAFADGGIEKLKKFADALIVVPNDRLLQLSERTTSLAEAFAMADTVLRQAVQGVTDIITKPGEINVDFADLKSVMQHAGGAVMGVGSGKGETRADDALRRAMECPLMENSVYGAQGVILNVTASSSIGLQEVQEAARKLQDLIDPDATFKWGMVYDEDMADEVQMIVIATGFDLDSGQRPGGSGKQPAKQEAASSESLFDMTSPIDTPAFFRMKGRKSNFPR
ncbi:MAG: cell division protein FtsZ [Synergistaceae bacterium]|nr:cell division protein FtsZ [Synergistaceae bacterium]